MTLKERRKLVVAVRETPLHRGHLELMLRLTDMGAILFFPPVPAFYHRPRDLEDIIRHSIGKILDLFDIEVPDFKRWAGVMDSPGSATSPSAIKRRVPPEAWGGTI